MDAHKSNISCLESGDDTCIGKNGSVLLNSIHGNRMKDYNLAGAQNLNGIQDHSRERHEKEGGLP